jgi:hypothetical protein
MFDTYACHFPYKQAISIHTSTSVRAPVNPMYPSPEIRQKVGDGSAEKIPHGRTDLERPNDGSIMHAAAISSAEVSLSYLERKVAASFSRRRTRCMTRPGRRWRARGGSPAFGVVAGGQSVSRSAPVSWRDSGLHGRSYMEGKACSRSPRRPVQKCADRDR